MGEIAYSANWSDVRLLLRMERSLDIPQPDPGLTITGFDRDRHQKVIPVLYSNAFGKEPWPETWDDFPDFDPAGVFLAHADGEPAGFLICFQRQDFGYISVIAVDPKSQRKRIATKLIQHAGVYLRSLHLSTVRIDAYQDSAPAVLTYQSLGFEIHDQRWEDE